MKKCPQCKCSPEDPCGATMSAVFVACAGFNRMLGIKRPGTDERLSQVERDPDPDTLLVIALKRYHAADDIYEK